MRKTVLIVDDNEDMLMMIKESLNLEGYMTITAENGKTALSSLNQNRVDIVLLDVMLPDVDGRLLCKKIRAEYTMPIIMISAKDKVEDKITGLDSGADDYIAKPFSIIELASRIRANLRRLKQQTTHFGKSIFIDLDERSIKKDNKAIHLTPKEWEILSYLVKHKEKVRRREEIISEVWGKDTLYNWSRVLDVHIQHIRKKIEDNPGNPLCIKTVPGVGYKIVI
ncbi:MAG: response regulator transcription factor [Epsilonproteobacteria bacterium]|nr:response regulator transcription factor [Campylobacterota bacterium]